MVRRRVPKVSELRSLVKIDPPSLHRTERALARAHTIDDLRTLAKRRIPTRMDEWAEFLDRVLTLDSRELLQSAGSIAKEVADRYAVDQYKTFRVRQDAEYVSDFDAFAARAEEAIEQRKDDD